MKRVIMVITDYPGSMLAFDFFFCAPFEHLFVDIHFNNKLISFITDEVVLGGRVRKQLLLSRLSFLLLYFRSKSEVGCDVSYLTWKSRLIRYYLGHHLTYRATKDIVG